MRITEASTARTTIVSTTSTATTLIAIGGVATSGFKGRGSGFTIKVHIAPTIGPQDGRRPAFFAIKTISSISNSD
jgi:hypothetical protein